MTPDEVLARWDGDPNNPTIWPNEAIQALRQALLERDGARADYLVQTENLATTTRERDEARAALNRISTICGRAQEGDDWCEWLEAIARVLQKSEDK